MNPSPSYVRIAPEALFEDIRRQYGGPHFPTPRNPAGNLNEPFWAALYRTEHDILFESNENQFYQFARDIYRPRSEHAILNQIAERLREAAAASQYERLAELTGRRHVSGVIAHLKGQVEKVDAFVGDRNFIHVANGVLDLNGESINLLRFSPQLVSRSLIPIAYDANAECKRFKEKLLVLLDKEDQLLLQKFLGLFLLGSNIIQKLLILHGLGETGKSTFSEVARRLTGVANCSELRTHLLAERFEIGSYIGKHLLIGADVSSTFLNSKGAHCLKKIVGGDLLDAERKGSNHRFQIPGTFNVLITSNSRMTLRLENDRGPWERRLAIVEYEKPRTWQIIPEFAQVLIREEGSGILKFALEGLIKLRGDIKNHGTLQLSAAQNKRVQTLLAESDSLRLFLQEYVETAFGFNLTTAEIVERYAGVCSDHGWNMTIRKTEEQLPDLMMELFQVARSNNIKRLQGEKETSLRGYRGVNFK
jgi:P4 family phage/plasmid primase-like protien